MKVLVGLGNPGREYKENRHNVGHMFVDYLKKFHVLRSTFFALKTDCFMNQSGRFIKKLTTSYSLLTTNLWIVHDDLDIPLGKFKINRGTGPKVHNGLSSIEQVSGTKDFWRIRIGVDNRQPTNRIDGETYVLQNFTGEEQKIINSTFPKIVTLLKTEYKFTLA